MHVKTNAKILLTALVVAVATFALAPQTPVGQALWGEPNHDAEATGAQVPLFLIIVAIESMATGIGVGYLFFGKPYSDALAGRSGAAATAVHVSISWILMNWWFHDSWHYVNGLDLTGLLLIEYLFHVTLIAAGLTLLVVAVRRTTEHKRFASIQ